jgi:predicted nuclease with RNAse H fold
LGVPRVGDAGFGRADFSTAGLDLASQDNRTAMAEIRWGSGGAVLQAVQMGVDNDAIVDAAGRVAVVGIDCPLGWPRPFVDLLTAARAGPVPADTAKDDAAKQTLVLRRTDFVVHEVTGRWPLSVAADRIAYPALRCAGLLARLSNVGHLVRRSGIDSVVAEVYPAAALRTWRQPTAGYKTDRTKRESLVASLVAGTPWLDWSSFAAACARDHDALDAVVCALVAGAVVLGRTALPGTDMLALADEEGWIHLPDGTFLVDPFQQG